MGVPPFTGVAVKTTLVLLQIAPLGFRVMLTEGAKGVFTVTANVRGADEPQALLATTVTFPETPAATAEMAVVDDTPVHPVGKVHVKLVVLLILAILYVLVVC